LVIGYWNLKFIWNLVLGAWDLRDCPLACEELSRVEFGILLLGFDEFG